ncbi:hypothetical protein [Streptomyces sp. NPDC050263]|uniref:hypothetical protein n=1 Tax=Streptomyces sp. NPDC050263 TaxID=3155037 RepID=UPI00341AAF27
MSTQKQKTKAVAAAGEARVSRPAANPAADSALKAKTVAASKGQASGPVTDPATVRVLKMKTIAMHHAPKG